MCNCREGITKRLLGMFKEQAPEATGHSVKLTGYALIFGEKLKEYGCMDIELTARYPLKKGGLKDKKSKQNMLFTYCPFCGEKYDDENPSTEVADGN